MGQYLNLERLGTSAIVTLSHPPSNLLTVASLIELAAQLEVLELDGTVRAVVITGAGDAYFSAGVPLEDFSRGDAVAVEQLVSAMCSAFRAIRRFNGVVIAAVNGYALGAGLECALSCDYIVAEKGAKLGMPQARLGQIPFAGGAKLLFDRVGEAWTKRMVLGGELLDAEQAIRIGLIEELVDPGFAKIIGVSLANKVARQGPVAVRESRRLIQACGSVSLEEHLPAARKALLALVGAEEQKAGVQAFLDQHNPPWCTDEDDED